MGKKPEFTYSPNSVEGQIIWLLEKNTAVGRRSGEVYADWLSLVQATMEAIPAHLRSVVQHRRYAEDTDTTQALWERMRHYYRRDHFENFSKAMALLFAHVEACEQDVALNRDILGSIYMAFGWPSSGLGQFFTPWPVALLMAKNTLVGETALLMKRLREAFDEMRSEGSLEAAMLETSVLTASALNQASMLESHVLPLLAARVKPVQIQDPACGSGIMLLAAAAQFPGWATRWGLVRFYGQDLDGQCVQMGSINMMLYGLNGWWLRWQVAAAGMAEVWASERPIEQQHPVEHVVEPVMEVPFVKMEYPVQPLFEWAAEGARTVKPKGMVRGKVIRGPRMAEQLALIGE